MRAGMTFQCRGEGGGIAPQVDPDLSLLLLTIPRGRPGKPGQWLVAFVPAGRGNKANEKVCGSKVWSSGGVLSSLTFQAQLASGISQKKCRGRGKTTLHQPTHPLTHPAFSDSWFPPGLGLGHSSNPCPRGSILPPTEGSGRVVGQWGRL